MDSQSSSRGHKPKLPRQNLAPCTSQSGGLGKAVDIEPTIILFNLIERHMTTRTVDDLTACGIANYSSEDIARIRGLKSREIEDTLGYHYGQEVVHRNNLVLL